MTIAEIINNQYGECFAIKLIEKCKSLNISNEAMGTVDKHKHKSAKQKRLLVS